MDGLWMWIHKCWLGHGYGAMLWRAGGGGREYHGWFIDITTGDCGHGPFPKGVRWIVDSPHEFVDPKHPDPLND